jgi:phage antirepressor YoqD-like protein
MNNNLSLVKKDYFNGVECDFWTDENNNIYMTSEQLGRALGYANPRISISTLVNRKEYLKDSKYSSVISMITEAGKRNTRVFTEKGIYEVIFLSDTKKALEFKEWVSNILEGLRKNQIELKFKIPQTMAEALRLAAELQEKIEADKPKIELYNQCMDAKNGLTMLEAAKALNIKSIGRNKLFEILRNEKILMSDTNKNLPYQQYINQGYFTTVIEPINDDGKIKDVTTAIVTPKGLEYIFNLLKVKGYIQ